MTRRRTTKIFLTKIHNKKRGTVDENAVVMVVWREVAIFLLFKHPDIKSTAA